MNLNRETEKFYFFEPVQLLSVRFNSIGFPGASDGKGAQNGCLDNLVSAIAFCID